MREQSWTNSRIKLKLFLFVKSSKDQAEKSFDSVFAFEATSRFFSPDFLKWWVMLIKWIRLSSNYYMLGLFIWISKLGEHILYCHLYFNITLPLQLRGIFRNMSNIYDGAFSKKSYWPKSVNCFREKAHHICFRGF